MEPQRSECQFCHAHFSTKGTYGRHLDQKKGDAWHPAEAVEALRGHVVRRGERAPVAQPQLAERRRAISKKYNSGPASERNKQRRRQRDLRIKASLHAAQWFLDKLAGKDVGAKATEVDNSGGEEESEEENGIEESEGKNGIAEGKNGIEEIEGKIGIERGAREEKSQGHGRKKRPGMAQERGRDSGVGGAQPSGAESFPLVVAAVVPPAQWPAPGVAPGEDHFAAALRLSPAPGPDALYALFAEWRLLGAREQLCEWRAAVDRAVRRHLGHTSLADISGAQAAVRAKSDQLYEEYASGMMDMLVMDQDPII